MKRLMGDPVKIKPISKKKEMYYANTNEQPGNDPA